MTVLWSIHLYPPIHNCGAEYMAHNINKFLIEKGHHARVLLHQANRHRITKAYEFEKVMVYPPDQPEGLARTADVIFTHLDYTHQSVQLARKTKRPLVHFVHNSSPYPSIINAPEAYVVYNSEWIKKELGYPNKSFVLTPPCDYRYYDTGDPSGREYITLVNLDWNKGGHILAEIAKRMPDKKFLAVRGSYSYDDRGQITDQPANVTVVPNTPDILEVYRKSRVIIMPSLYESWGRVATEAMCSGIPVVCSATPGLVENTGAAGLLVHDRDDIGQWVRWIKRLDDPKFYNQVSKLSRERSRELDPVKKLEEFLNWLQCLT